MLHLSSKKVFEHGNIATCATKKATVHAIQLEAQSHVTPIFLNNSVTLL